MTGNPKLKHQGPSGGPPTLKFQGQIINGQCWFWVDVGNPLAPRPIPMKRVQALIDTGATASSINQDLAKLLGITGRGKRQIQGAGGAHDCTTAPALIGFQLPGGQTVARSVDVAILPMVVPLLFGMAELAAGCLVVDGVNGVWRWTLPPGSIKLNPVQPPTPKAGP